MTDRSNILGDMPADEFRRHGYALIDKLADYFEHIDERPVLSPVLPDWLRTNLPDSPPAAGEDFSDVLADVERLILPAVTNWSHPNFHGLFSTSASSVNVFGEMLAAAFDMKAMLWRTAPASAELEDVVLDWLRQIVGLPHVFEGIIYDTASVSTMHAIAAARDAAAFDIRQRGMSGRTDLPQMRVYCSQHVHSSIDKACITLGLGLDALVKIDCDERFAMRPDELRKAIEDDLAAGRVPICVIPTIGTTSSAAIDPVTQIADICERFGIWLHVDAAYAGPAAALPEKRGLFSGWERADSIVINPHKWFFTSFDLSVLFCRDLDRLRKAFSLIPEYLRTDDDAAVKNGMDYGIQLGRRFRALKLWFVMRYFGTEGLVARLRDHCRLAEKVAARVDASPNFELAAPVDFALVCFRMTAAGVADAEQIGQLNERLMNEVNATGRAYLSHTKLNGLMTLRLSVGSIHVTDRHIDDVWQLIETTADQILGRERTSR